MESFFTFSNFADLITLTGLEIVLGIDNVIFIALVVQGLPREKMLRARVIGISLALILRILMLSLASMLIGLTKPLFHIMDFGFSGRNILLIAGGLFLVGKCLMELYEMFDHFALKHIGERKLSKTEQREKADASYMKIVGEIIFVDFIFSFDSVIVAVGMTNNLSVIFAAVTISMLIMLMTVRSIGDFIHQNPSIKVLAIAFILLIGIFLIANGFDIELNKQYLYFAMFFSVITEAINIKLGKKKQNYIEHGGKI